MDEGQLIGGTAAGQRYAAVSALADETNGTFCTATLVTKNVIVTAMYRKFTPPFFCPELYRRTREPSSAGVFSENPGVASVARAMQRSEARDWLAVAALAQTQSERQRSASVSNPFGLSGRLQ
jgi:hypothetical protein